MNNFGPCCCCCHCDDGDCESNGQCHTTHTLITELGCFFLSWCAGRAAVFSFVRVSRFFLPTFPRIEIRTGASLLLLYEVREESIFVDLIIVNLSLVYLLFS